MKSYLVFFVLIVLVSCVSVVVAADKANTVRAIFDRVRTHDFEKNSGYSGVPDTGDKAWRVRMLAIRDLVLAGESHGGEIIAALDDDNRHVRHVAVAAIGVLQLKGAGEKLVELLAEDNDPIVRGQAAQSIGQIGYIKGLEALEDVKVGRNVIHRAGLAALRLKTEGGIKNRALLEAWKGLDEKSFERMAVGQAAPDFMLKDTDGKSWRLSDLKGKKTVVLIWIFADWCPVCQREFHDLGEMEGEFKAADVQVLTIECHDAHRAKAMVGKADFWWPHLVDNAGAIGAMYGVDPMEFVVHDEWINRPATIIIDKEGVVRFSYCGTYWGDRPTIGETLEMIKKNSYKFEHPERRK